jgi:hypothetical protein
VSGDSIPAKNIEWFLQKAGNTLNLNECVLPCLQVFKVRLGIVNALNHIHPKLTKIACNQFYGHSQWIILSAQAAAVYANTSSDAIMKYYAKNTRCHVFMVCKYLS